MGRVPCSGATIRIKDHSHLHVVSSSLEYRKTLQCKNHPGIIEYLTMNKSFSPTPCLSKIIQEADLDEQQHGTRAEVALRTDDSGGVG